MFDDVYLDADGGAIAAANTPTGGDQSGDSSAQAAEIRLTSAQFAERLERAKGTERTRLLQEFGFQDPEALKKALEDGQRAVQSQMTEQERLASELKTVREQAEALQQSSQAAQAKAQQAMLQAEALALMSGKFASPRAAFRLLDLSAVKSDESFTGLKEAIDKLAKDEPWTLSRTSLTDQAAIGATNPQGEAGKVDTDETRRARYFGSAGGGSNFFKGGGVKSSQ